ncbi:hydantoinase B/oxoprolinase family protein [Paracoccus sp. SCSIO 75233]|uniref:hydantoinase B/oxoprolinase family protein n=1 Tax=Paracoccus sp. SCSIO 75233 TaxID=3017782 RepID=UPI0022F096CA|nr:hydantoinase B/oxoprolinase family protein [Paracoccus sp. SCSIO 75233]WBU55348.1 hydantoinase B/oxoprolinase family protein [Paracoccus sp. SCSIO 75233]
MTHWFTADLHFGDDGISRDGMDSVDVLYANTRNNPIEDIESHVPLRIERYELREKVAAPGRWRGGVGSIRKLRFLSPGSASVESEGHKYPPRGLFGGSDGTPSQLIREMADGTEIQLPSKLPHHAFGKDESIVAVRACGGGYGDPLQRDPDDVLDDVLDGYITDEQAFDQYGVRIVDRKVDTDATQTARKTST